MQFPKSASYSVNAVIDLLLYSNIWIATGALAMANQTELILSGRLRFTKLDGFIFFGALFLYTLHRIIGLQKVSSFKEIGRFLVISKFKTYFIALATVSLLACAWFFLHLSRPLQEMAIVPAVVSLGYAIPFIAGNKRLRDLPFLKIFLIGPVWGWVTVLLPAMELGLWPNVPAGIIIAERVLFIFAISIAFDIRDLKLDQHTRVKTLPGQIGIRNSLWLATSAAALSFFFVYVNYRIDTYTSAVFLSLLVSLMITTILIWQSRRLRHDYFFSGLIDGCIVFQFLLVYLSF